MIKVAACGQMNVEGGSFASLLARCVEEQSAGEYALSEFTNAHDLVDACTLALAEEPFNLVVCAAELAGVSGVDVISELNSLYSYADDLRVVLCAAGPDHAYDAHALGVDGYLVEPVSADEFSRVVGRQLRELSLGQQESAIVRCRDRVRRVSFKRLSYAETADHDQVLHRVGTGETCFMRGSSRDLFSILESDGRFFKVGSSYIVNLDLVKALDMKNGVAKLVDGAEVPIPVRSRKPLEQALTSRGHVAL